MHLIAAAAWSVPASETKTLPFTCKQTILCPLSLTPRPTRTFYLGVDDGAGNLFHIGQVSSQGHQDRFSGQADLDDEGDACWSGR